MTLLAWLQIGIPSAALFVSICALIWQILRARRVQAVEMALQLDERFNGSEWREKRSNAASQIRNGRLDDEAEDVIDLFETMAFLTQNRKIIDQTAIWHFFSYWINNYYELMRPRIEERRRVDPTIWEDLVPFVEKLRQTEAKRRGLADPAQVIPKKDELEKFLAEECREDS